MIVVACKPAANNPTTAAFGSLDSTTTLCRCVVERGVEVINKYDGQLPLISNQKYNQYLKEIQKLAGIDTVITTHLLRKTYAHYMLNNGVRIETVARLLGHSNTNITSRIYCRKTSDTVAAEVAAVLNQPEPIS